MTWQSLGELALTVEWQTFPIAALDSETFKLIQPPGQPVDGYALIAPYYPMDGRGSARRLYPLDEPLIISLPIPKDYREQGLITRSILAKRSRRSRVLGGHNWLLEIQVFY